MKRHHLVIVRQPYLDRILSGRKRVELRLSSQRRPPFGAANAGDVLWFKPPCKPIVAVANVRDTQYLQITAADDIHELRSKYDRDIAAEPEFWRDLSWVRFASLIWLCDVLAIGPIACVKRDRRAWVVLDRPPRPPAPPG